MSPSLVRAAASGLGRTAGRAVKVPALKNNLTHSLESPLLVRDFSQHSSEKMLFGWGKIKQSISAHSKLFKRAAALGCAGIIAFAASHPQFYDNCKWIKDNADDHELLFFQAHYNFKKRFGLLHTINGKDGLRFLKQTDSRLSRYEMATDILDAHCNAGTIVSMPVEEMEGLFSEISFDYRISRKIAEKIFDTIVSKKNEWCCDVKLNIPITVWRQLSFETRSEYSQKVLKKFKGHNTLHTIDPEWMRHYLDAIPGSLRQDVVLEYLNSIEDNSAFEKVGDKNFSSILCSVERAWGETPESSKMWLRMIEQEKELYIISPESFCFYLETIPLAQREAVFFKYFNQVKEKCAPDVFGNSSFIHMALLFCTSWNHTLETSESYSRVMKAVCESNHTQEVINDQDFNATVTSKSARANLDTFFLLGNTFIKHPAVKELCIAINDYSAQEEQKGRVTFFHGQAWHWNLCEKLYRSLEETVNKKEVPENFLFLRWKERQLYEDDAQEVELQKTGMTWFGEDKRFFFTNSALLSSHSESNSVLFVVNNFDQSTKHRANMHTLEDIFKSFGLEYEVKLLEKQSPELFIKLEELHAKASQYGNFITVSMPQPVAAKVSYTTDWGNGGIKVVFPCGRKNSTNPVEVIQYNQGVCPFHMESVLVMGPTLCNSTEAQQEQVEIKQWNAANPEIIAQRDALIKEIINNVIELKCKKLSLSDFEHELVLP